MNQAYEIFRIRGIAVRLQPSLLLLGGLLVLLALGAGGSPAEVAWRLSAPVILFLTVLVHELGHATTARRQGIQVQDILLGPLGGAARLSGLMESPSKEWKVAAAGPVVNLVLAGGALLVGRLTGALSWHDLGTPASWARGDIEGIAESPLLSVIAFNALLGTLNLIPAFPMDGGRILRALLWTRIGRLRATRIASRIGMWFSLVLILAPFFMNDAIRWILPLLGITLILAGLKERLMVEAREGLFRMTSFGAPPDGAGAPGGSAGPARDDLDLSDGEVIDVTGRSHVVDPNADR